MKTTIKTHFHINFTNSEARTLSLRKMVPIKWLNNLLLLENLLGIYRNYYTQKNIKKCFIFFHIFVQTILHTLMTMLQVHLLYTAEPYKLINYIYCVFTISSYFYFLISVLISISYSRDFMLYYESISRVSEYFENDKKLVTSLKKLYWFSIIFTLLFLTFALYRSFDVILQFYQQNPNTCVYISFSTFLSQVLGRFLILYQNLMFFVVIMIVVFLSKCLNSLISAVKESVGSCDISWDEQCDITKEHIQEWAELYRDLANSCGKVSLSFGRQVIGLLLRVCPGIFKLKGQT